MSRDLPRSRYQWVKQLSGWKPLKVSHHPAKFGGHRLCGIRDIMVLVCHMISQDHKIKGLCDSMGIILSRCVTILQRMVVIGTLVVEKYFSLSRDLLRVIVM